MASWSDLPMSAAGKTEVALLAECLARTLRFDSIYSRLLCRARETAQTLSAHGLGKVYFCRGLMESIAATPMG